MSFLEIIGLAWIILLSWNFVSAFRELSQESKQRNEKIKEKLENAVREVYIDTIEQSGKLYFLVYDKKTNAFIAQGQDRNEIKSNIEIRYPGITFVVDDDSLQKMGG